LLAPLNIFYLSKIYSSK